MDAEISFFSYKWCRSQCGLDHWIDIEEWVNNLIGLIASEMLKPSGPGKIILCPLRHHHVAFWFQLEVFALQGESPTAFFSLHQEQLKFESLNFFLQHIRQQNHIGHKDLLQQLLYPPSCLLLRLLLIEACTCKKNWTRKHAPKRLQAVLALASFIQPNDSW